ncbi:N-acetyltransferase [Halogeometricum borinquense]|uniref:N-acetyltransferase n=1 Tax=Halogeometricum borinquense TaxID=60847 RepID=A0A482TV72_9EURY|nr:GNAT family N-acetyltransferase [Halogeometricum borinquense]RYJ19505.1 N-acetyltransferase [Halogeometricum borinquense]
MTTSVERLVSREEIFEGIDVWNRQHPDFRISDALIEQNLFAPLPDIEVRCYGGYDEHELVSFAVLKQLDSPVREFEDTDTAWLSLFAFEPDSERARTLGKDLLTTVVDKHVATDHSTLHFGCSPQNFVSGVPSTFPEPYRNVLRDVGFESQQTVYDLSRAITRFDDPATVESVGRELETLRVERATGSEADLLSFLEDQFPGRWYYEARNICRIPGGAADYWLLRWDGDVVGFARSNRWDGSYRGPNVNWGWRLSNEYCGVGPLGIHEEQQGRGWGLFMITKIVQRLKQDGYDTMVIDWTDIPGYYEKLGFERWISYERMARE